ncbi:Cobalamin adenosyltransferase [uncultured archaeon]|nr:Cobalamin adenosyltransferase [uncultured archaeon]
MSIVTKGGDKGETSLLGGQRVPKTDCRIEAYGTVDELNASIGVARSYVKDSSAKKTLHQVQNDLFKIGAELAGAKKKITAKDTKKIENEVYKIEKKLPLQKSFILPAGNQSSTHLHLARTICRRAERRVLPCKPNPEIIRYLNRLGDLLFIYARLENRKDEAVRY